MTTSMEKILRSSIVYKQNTEDSFDPEEQAKDFLVLSSERTREIPRFPRSSAMYSDCIRQLILCRSMKKEIDRFSNPSLQMTFEIGNAVHHWIQNTPNILGNNRYGKWQCTSCNYTTLFRGPITGDCPRCSAKATAFVYKEIGLVLNNPYYLSGHPDMFVKTGNDIYNILEIKTINSNDFRSIKAPLINHLYQIHSYMLLTSYKKFKLSAHISNKESYVLYISKAHESSNYPAKLYKITRDKNITKDILSKLKSFKQGIENKILSNPDDTCVNSGFVNYKSKSCPVSAICKELNDNKLLTF